VVVTRGRLGYRAVHDIGAAEPDTGRGPGVATTIEGTEGGRAMKKYLFIVYGPPAENEDERSMGMRLMAEWYRSLGSALLDPGAPFTAARTVSSGGAGNAIGPNATGYNVVQADSMEAAIALAKKCPLLEHGRSVTVLETLPT
jgi:hypothetical protein